MLVKFTCEKSLAKIAGEMRVANLRDQDRRADQVAARQAAVVVDLDLEQAHLVVVGAVRDSRAGCRGQIGVDVRDRAFQRELRRAFARYDRDAAAERVARGQRIAAVVHAERDMHRRVAGMNVVKADVVDRRDDGSRAGVGGPQ